jgi:IS5 family transposase
MIAANELLEHARDKALIGDTGYDSNDFIQAVRDKGMRPVIHSKPERKKKHRYEKTARNDLALVQLVCGWLCLSGN